MVRWFGLEGFEVGKGWGMGSAWMIPMVTGERDHGDCNCPFVGHGYAVEVITPWIIRAKGQENRDCR